MEAYAARWKKREVHERRVCVLRARAWLQHDAIHCGRVMQSTIRTPTIPDADRQHDAREREQQEESNRRAYE